jgi:hypothetical protein
VHSLVLAVLLGFTRFYLFGLYPKPDPPDRKSCVS